MNSSTRVITILFVVGVLLVAFSALAKRSEAVPAQSTNITQLRCGWFVNPTPANAWLVDRQGEWTIAIQGGFQADGDWPDFSERQFVKTNGPHGYGCVCLRGKFDMKNHTAVEILTATPKPLSACRRDPGLRKKEPK